MRMERERARVAPQWACGGYIYISCIENKYRKERDGEREGGEQGAIMLVRLRKILLQHGSFEAESYREKVKTLQKHLNM